VEGNKRRESPSPAELSIYKMLFGVWFVELAFLFFLPFFIASATHFRISDFRRIRKCLEFLLIITPLG